jgi:hypothetical protein
MVVGAGQRHVRIVWANTGALHLGSRTFTITEAWASRREAENVVDRSASR